jgi:hypothetical protein
MTGEKFAHSGISGAGREPRVNGGVLDMGMPQPVFVKWQIRAGVSEVHGNRVFQTHVWLHRVDRREGTLEPVNGEAALLKVDIGAPQQADLGCPQAMAMGEEEDGPIAFGFDHGQETFALLLGKKVDNTLQAPAAGFSWGGFGGCHVLDFIFSPCPPERQFCSWL